MLLTGFQHPTLFYAINFINANTGFTVGANGSIYETTDGANTWQAEYYDTSTTNFYCVSTMNINTAYVGGQFGKIIGTTDQGYNWSVEPSGVNTILLWNPIRYPNKRMDCGQNGIILHTKTEEQLESRRFRMMFPLLFRYHKIIRIRLTLQQILSSKYPKPHLQNY